jgi:hypothetical protein
VPEAIRALAATFARRSELSSANAVTAAPTAHPEVIQ